MDKNFIGFCSWICKTYTAEQLNDMPKDKYGFIDFSSLYLGSKYREYYEMWLGIESWDAYHSSENVVDYPEIDYKSEW
tara:strand:- start:18788 stop:19021 length:234 start_codon:yes stop_codon:yes gene_type:complete